MKVLVAGSSGFVGSRLVPALQAGGHETVRLVRHGPQGAGQALWRPGRGELAPELLDGADAVVNLAGAGIAGHRWTPAYRQVLRESRIAATRTLASAAARCVSPPSVLVNASATGYYGDRGDEPLDEASPGGRGFLAELAADWEAEALAARALGMRVVLLRFGMIVGPGGGALERMLTPFRLGLGGPLGRGRQWWSWVALEDAVRAVVHAVEEPVLSGPVNVTAPAPLRNREFTRVLARALHRPAVLPAPAPILRLALGDMADELLLASTRALPRALESAGFAFHKPRLEDALDFL